MEKKGFTLVELLAVIVIIGLLVVLIIPKVSSTIGDSRKNSGELSTKALAREAANYYLAQRGKGDSFTGCEYDFDTNTNTCTGFEFTGEKPESGVLKINSDGDTVSALRFDDYCFIDLGQDELLVEKYNEETCKISEPVAFSTDNWATIVAAVRLNNTSVYNLGDTKQIDLEGFGTHTLRIVNMSTPDECNTSGFSQTSCGFVIEFVDSVAQHRMNPYDENSSELGNGSIGGWEYSEARQFVNNDIYNSLPTELKSSIKDTYVVSNTHEGMVGTIDKLYLPVFEELTTPATDPLTLNGLTRKLDFYYIDAYHEEIIDDKLSSYYKYNPRGSNIWTRAIRTDQPYYFFYLQLNSSWQNIDHRSVQSSYYIQIPNSSTGSLNILPNFRI